MMNIGQRSFKFKLGLLAWKSLCFRLNNMTLSSLEIFLPLIYIFTFLRFNDVLHQEKSVTNHSALSKFISEEFLFSYTFSNNSIYIIYTPSNKWCEQLMRCVGSTLKIAKKDISIVPMGDKLQLKSLIQKMKNKIEIIFIQFHTDNEHNENSTNLIYSIRYLENNYLTFEGQQDLKDINFNHYTMPAAWEEFVYWKTGYAGLELAIDKSFISMVATNRSISKLNIRPFPYPVRPLSHSNYVDGIEMSRAIVIAFFALRIVCIYFVYKEKQTGVIEYACALSMEKWMFYINWFICVCIEYGILVTGIVYVLYFEHPTILDHPPVLRASEPFSIWCLFIIYVMADVLSNLVFCSMSKSRNLSMFFGIIFWTIPFILYNYIEAKPSKITFLSSHVYWLVVSPTIAFQFALEALFVLENNHYGFNLIESFIENETLDVVAQTVITLLMSIIVYICIIWLVESRFSFWNYKVKIMMDSEPENIALFSKSNQNMRSIDRPLPWMKIAIKIINLHKLNELHNTIKGLHMDIYMGHITVLLSPNLVNVITILQILTGMVQASYGKIIVQGTNVLQYSNKFKHLLGFSTDVNALFNSLSVKEHLMFFSMLRGMTLNKAKHEAFYLITFLNLKNQASCTPGMLSLGIRKRLCLAISLIGDPEILILNQPTEHVDSESTKQLRDKIIAMRGRKTIIVATQSWDEATKLGDRIAVINRGTLICYGTLSFLKQHYGSHLNCNIFYLQTL